MLYLGCHLSSSKGYATMGKTALSIGANTFQFFTRNPRGGAAKSADPADAATLVQMQRDGRLGPLVAHAPYTLNPCSKDERTREFAREVFADDLLRMELTPGSNCTPRCTACAATLDVMLTETLPTPSTVLAAATNWPRSAGTRLCAG